MRITEGRIRQIIREETRRILNEAVLNKMSDNQLEYAADDPGNPDLIDLISAILVEKEGWSSTTADRRAEDLFKRYKEDNRYAIELNARKKRREHLKFQPEREEEVEEEEAEVDNWSPLHDALFRVVEAFTTDAPQTSPKYEAVHRMGRYILSQLDVSSTDLQQMMDDNLTDEAIDLMMQGYKQNIATLPKDDPARIRFDGEIAKIKKLMGI